MAKRKKDEQVKVGISQLEVEWGISNQAIYKHVKEGHIPPPVEGKWDWPFINHVFIEYFKKLAAGTGTTSLTEKRAKGEDLDNSIKEIELQSLQGRLINKADEDLRDFRAARAVRDGVITACDRAKAQLPGEVAHIAYVKFMEEINQALSELSKYEIEEEKTAIA